MTKPSGSEWTAWNNCLVGINADRWRRLRRETTIDPEFRKIAAYLTAMSLLNTAQERREERRFGEAVAKTELVGAPVFILGHWRSGTTFLHELLSRDTEQFACPNGMQVTFPSSFLTTEEVRKRMFAGKMPKTRPMDNVAIGMDTPQEDEFALCAASLRSPYLGMFLFPRQAERFTPYLTFRGVPEAEVEEWKATFRWFLRKLTVRYRRGLLLKSPTHTARVRLLLELFPGVRFVHLRRGPYATFQSTRHTNEKMLAINQLQRPDPNADLDGQILSRYTAMYDAYFEEKALIPAGRLHEVRYEELERDPVGQVRAIYDALGLDGFEAMRPALEGYVASLSGYRKNRFEELPPAVKQRVAAAWERSFELWGYSA